MHEPLPSTSVPAGVSPPAPAECAAIWPATTRIPTTPSRPHPAVWLMGCHGGAGVSTLEALIAPAGDCQRSWPGGHPEQSPFVVLVAAETATGMDRAHVLLRQYHSRMAGPGNRLLGLVTVATAPGRRPSSVKQARELLAPLAGNLWEIPFFSEYRELLPKALPAWHPGDEVAERKRRFDYHSQVPPEVAAMAADVVALIRSSYQQERP